MVDITTETLYTIPEIADRFLKIERKCVRDLFENEPGVICIGNKATIKGKRRYRNFRVPASVLNRVIARLSNRVR